MSIAPRTIEFGDVRLKPEFVDGELRSLGPVEVGGNVLRSSRTRWLPWFDLFEGGPFNHFRFTEATNRGQTTVLQTQAICDNDYPFRERRDASGDLCFRATNWDAQPEETSLDICFEPAAATVDGRQFTGFRYWFEYSGGPSEIAIHRLVDRATWELGGELEGNTLVCRNWLTPPRVRLARDFEYSTVGLDQWAALLPGNLWARWSLLPAFDMQYGPQGVLLGWFDEMSLIRTVIESGKGEDVLRVLDMHLFEQSAQVRTNPKTILYSPDVLDDTDALNLWTRVHDAEAEKVRAQYDIPPEASPRLFLGCNQWQNFRFDSTYDGPLDVAAAFGLDYIFIDSVFEHQRALKESFDELVPPEQQKGTIFEKFFDQNMCVTLDYEVAKVHGGEEGLKRFCQRAEEKGVQVLSWMATHLSPNSSTSVSGDDGSHGGFGFFAAKESGRHPDTGYARSCWTMNLNTPIYEKFLGQMVGVCQRTGLKGFLWDSFSNLGWWQLDYAGGTMRPQFDKMTELYAELRRADIHLLLEAVVGFSNQSCCGMHGGEVYAGDQMGYAYNSAIALSFGKFHGKDSPENQMLRGVMPLDRLFHSLAHKRAPSLGFHSLPRADWNEEAAEQIKAMFAAYKRLRDQMQIRTVLKNEAGVLWESDQGAKILWSFQGQEVPQRMCCVRNLLTDTPFSGGQLQALAIYEMA